MQRKRHVLGAEWKECQVREIKKKVKSSCMCWWWETREEWKLGEVREGALIKKKKIVGENYKTEQVIVGDVYGERKRRMRRKRQ